MRLSTSTPVSALAALILALVCLPGLASAMPKEEVARKLEAMTWYSEEYPPFNKVGEDGIPTGISVDILNATFKKIGVNLSARDIKIEPWDETYQKTQTIPNTVLFFMTHTEKRAEMFQFALPGVESKLAVAALKESQFENVRAAEVMTEAFKSRGLSGSSAFSRSRIAADVEMSPA